MINAQSPQFCNSGKIDLSKLSPCIRSKRTPSASDNFSCYWNRANSCKRLDSPSEMSEKQRKRSHNSQKRMKSKSNNISNSIADELNTLKNEYATLKTAYRDFIQSKVKHDEEANKLKQ
jgi:hypothetical protein